MFEYVLRPALQPADLHDVAVLAMLKEQDRNDGMGKGFVDVQGHIIANSRHGAIRTYTMQCTIRSVKVTSSLVAHPKAPGRAPELAHLCVTFFGSDSCDLPRETL